MLNVAEELNEDVPITEQIKTPPPPPPPQAPEIIEIVEDAAEIEETVIESTESSQDQVVEAVVDVDDVEVGEEDEDISVPLPLLRMCPFTQVVRAPRGMQPVRLVFKRKSKNILKKNSIILRLLPKWAFKEGFSFSSPSIQKGI